MATQFQLRLFLAVGLAALSSQFCARCCGEFRQAGRILQSHARCPMRQMSLILKPQEFEDVKEFLKSLK